MVYFVLMAFATLRDKQDLNNSGGLLYLQHAAIFDSNLNSRSEETLHDVYQYVD